MYTCKFHFWFCWATTANISDDLTYSLISWDAEYNIAGFIIMCMYQCCLYSHLRQISLSLSKSCNRSLVMPAQTPQNLWNERESDQFLHFITLRMGKRLMLWTVPMLKLSRLLSRSMRKIHHGHNERRTRSDAKYFERQLLCLGLLNYYGKLMNCVWIEDKQAITSLQHVSSTDWFTFFTFEALRWLVSARG